MVVPMLERKKCPEDALDFRSSDEVVTLARKVISDDAEAILAVLPSVDASFVASAEILARCEGKILVTGSGTSGAIANRAAHLLSVGGTPAFSLSPADGLHGGLGVLRPNDVVLAISKGGSSKELNEFCERARTLSGCLIAITSDSGSQLAQLADHVLKLNLPAHTDLGSVMATGCSLAAAALTDALVEAARIMRGYSWAQVLFTHPSGAVGRDAELTLERLNQAEGL
jgi:D-arabinose 5-phosphate isomerase GutQ